jgi:hypothetical protein
MTDQPTSPPDRIVGIEIPDGLTIIKELSNATANNLLDDAPFESVGNGRNYLEEIVHHALNGDALRTYSAVVDMITDAGESDFAISEWKRETAWVDGNQSIAEAAFDAYGESI